MAAYTVRSHKGVGMPKDNKPLEIRQWTIHDLWAKYEEIAMHFNDLLRTRRRSSEGCERRNGLSRVAIGTHALFHIGVFLVTVRLVAGITSGLRRFVVVSSRCLRRLTGQFTTARCCPVDGR